MFCKQSAKEVDLFDEISTEWWKNNGQFKILHSFNRVRIPYIKQSINSYFKLNNNWQNLNILDIGCGGGLISEELAKLKANVTAIDSSAAAIKVAEAHAAKNGLSINYIHTKVESLPLEPQYDVILLLEVLEHVDNLNSFLAVVFKLVKADGIILFSTVNRNLKSLLLAKIVAEYILHWVPKGIHNYKKFIKPFELQQMFLKHNFEMADLKGIDYNFHFNNWNLANKPTINYIGYAKSVHSSCNK